MICKFDRTRKSKWDVPGEQAENYERRNSGSSNEAAQLARERAAQLAAKLAAEGKLAAGVAPPPVIVSYSPDWKVCIFQVQFAMA